MKSMKKAITRFNFARQILELPFWTCIRMFFNSDTIKVDFIEEKEK